MTAGAPSQTSVHPADRPVFVLAARVTLMLAVLSYILLALAEQGGIGTEIPSVPDSPLPFQRSEVFGADLSGMTSAQAASWLESAGSDLPFVLIPVDADIVDALAEEETNETGIRTLDTLFAPSGEATIAVCVRKPISPLTDIQLADGIVGALVDRFPDRVAYIRACDPGAEPAWHDLLMNQTSENSVTSDDYLAPLTVGAALALRPISSPGELELENLRNLNGSGYVLPVLPVSEPIDAETAETARGALRDAAQVALVMLRPAAELPAPDIAASVEGVRLDDPALPEGFTSSTSSQVAAGDEWRVSSVGAIDYRQADAPGATMTVEFVGTSIYLLGLLSPDAGNVNVWIDTSPETAAGPNSQVLLDASQAQDAALILADDLPAARHRITLTTSDGPVAVSGFFVRGQPESQWNGGLAAVGLILTAIAALSVVSLARVRAIRRRTRPPTPENPYDVRPRSITGDR